MSKPEKFLRLPTVVEYTALSRSTIYDLMHRDEFPRQVRIGRRAVAWREREIVEWISSRAAKV